MFQHEEGSFKTQIMYRANLSFAQLNEQLSFLQEVKLLKVKTEDLLKKTSERNPRERTQIGKRKGKTVDDTARSSFQSHIWIWMHTGFIRCRSNVEEVLYAVLRCRGVRLLLRLRMLSRPQL
jgi:hypothetical protein